MNDNGSEYMSIRIITFCFIYVSFYPIFFGIVILKTKKKTFLTSLCRTFIRICIQICIVIVLIFCLSRGRLIAFVSSKFE